MGGVVAGLVPPIPANVGPLRGTAAQQQGLLAYDGGGRSCSPSLAAANASYHDRRFAGCVLVSDNQSWVGTGRNGSTAVTTERQTFVRNQVRPHGREFAGPKLVSIDLQPHTTAQAPNLSNVLNVGVLSDAVFP